MRICIAASYTCGTLRASVTQSHTADTPLPVDVSWLNVRLIVSTSSWEKDREGVLRFESEEYNKSELLTSLVYGWKDDDEQQQERGQS